MNYTVLIHTTEAVSQVPLLNIGYNQCNIILLHPLHITA